MRTNWFTALALATALVSGPVQANAQDQTQIAQQGFEEGARAYLAGRYEEAIVTWQKAYEIWPAGIILYNMSLAASKLGNPQQAYLYAQRAAQNEDMPLDGEYRAKNAANIRALEARFAAEDTARELLRANPIEPEMKLSLPGYVGTGVGVLGLGLVGGAIATGAKASKQNAALGDVDEYSVYEQRVLDFEKTQSTGRVLLYSGLGLFVVGSGLVVWDLFLNKTEVQVAGIVDPRGHVAVQIGWDF